MTIKHVSRRDFLKFTGLSSGGLMLGASTAGVPMNAFAGAAPDFPISPETPKDALALNIFVQIGTDNKVYIVSHRSEMGQGSRTGVPQVIADELDADWENVVVVQAQGDAAYGSQNTDGSRSIRNHFTRLRQMGAAARYMLQQAAAKEWGISTTLVDIKNHQALRKDKKMALSFGELAEAASKIPYPDHEKLSFKKAFKRNYIGKSVEIVDMEKITTGQTVFGNDVMLDGMVFASTEHCPYMGGELVSFDDKEARKVPGVLDIIEIEHRPQPSAFHPLAGVAVVATNTWAAFEARKKLKIEWKASPHQKHNSSEQMAEMRKALTSATVTVARKKGDPASAFKSASGKIDKQYTVPYLVHAQMEPVGCAAIAKEHSIEVWACTQTPQSAQKELATRFDIDPKRVKVNVTLLGGGFGRKSKPDFIVEAAVISKKLGGKPVRLMWTREDDTQMGYYHAHSAIRMQAAWDKNKKVTGLQSTAAYPSIVSLWNPNQDHPDKFELELGLINTPFDIPNEQVGSVPTKAHTRIGWMRSVCNIQQAFAVGSFVDELALKLKKQPVDMWMELIGKDRKIDYKDHGYDLGNYGSNMDDFPFESARLKNVLKKVVDKSQMRSHYADNEGWGVSCHYSFISHIAVATRVKLNGGNVEVKEVHIAIDCGLAVNPDRVKSQMEGSVIFGLSLALMGEITFDKGQVQQSNFNDYPVTRMNQCPDIHVHLIKSDGAPRGVGEPGVPPVAASLTNAIFAAGGERIRDLPVNKVYKV